MKRCLFLFAMGFWVFSTPAQVNRWNEVIELERQSLPASALEAVNGIYQEALNSGNTPGLLKALIYQLKYETAIDSDVLPDRIRDIEQLAGTEKDPVGQAVLYSLLAELYTNYYQANAYSINQRTDMTGDAPEDVREWTRNQFIGKAKALVHLSLLPASELQTTATSAYREILTEGESAQELRPSMYDFLMAQGIQTLNQYREKEALYATLADRYEQWLDFRKSQADKDSSNRLALLMVELSRIAFIRDNAPSGNAGEEYIRALSELENRYRGEDICVEILYKKVAYYDEFPHSEDHLKQACAICTDGLKTYPAYNRKGLLQNLLSEITQSRLNVQGDNAVYPGKDLKLTLTYRNMDRLTVGIYRIGAPVSAYRNTWQREGQYKKSGRLVEKRQVDLKPADPWLDTDTALLIPVKEPGNYEYVIYSGMTDSVWANRQFSVSRLATVTRAIDGSREYLVADRMSGKPLEGAELRFYTQKNNIVSFSQKQQTDKNGLATGGDAKDLVFYNASFGNDTALALSPLPWVSSYRENTASVVQSSLFTDRSLYRPGQTIYFKGIVFEAGKRVVPNKTCTLVFRDANGKEIATQTLKTHAFGSFSGEFVVPQGLLNGRFTLQSDIDGAYASVKVEEYKRPAFDIQFAPNSAAYRLGDTVTVNGTVKTFSGVPLQNVQVRYRIMRQHHWLFRMRYFQPIPVAEGSVQTLAGGRFDIHFPADKRPEDYSRQEVYYTYAVEATVTGANGETQTSDTRLSVGDKSMYLTFTGLNDVVEKEKEGQVITVHALNLAGNPVPAQGKYEIYRLKAQDNTRFDADEANWIPDKRIVAGEFVAGKEMASPGFRSFVSGRYRITVKALDNHGKEVEAQQDFILASPSDKRPPVPVYEWMMTPKTVCAVGEKAEIIYGSSAKDVYVLYELFKDNRKIATSRLVLNNENRKIEIPFLDAYGDGITASFSFIKDGKFFTRNVRVNKKQADQTLNLQMEVFRDRLLPGQTEEWKLSVKDAGGHPATAELLAGMYDASLDKIYAHQWNFNPVRQLSEWMPYNRTGGELNTSNASFSHNIQRVEVPGFVYKAFNWFGFSVYNSRSVLRGGSVSESDVPIRIRGLSPLNKTPNEVMDLTEAADISAEGLSEPPVPIRENFAETAFFYPQLKTNEAGETVLSFTVPESNTAWKFMGLAHTQDLKFGQIVREAISQKQLMIAPHIPRFLRAGDKATLVSSVSNLTDQTLSGTATIDFFDPVSNQTTITVAGKSLPFTVEAGQTVPVSWSFEVPGSLDLTGIRIVAATSGFSDGEQHLVPVLPNRMPVTESLQLNVLGGQTRTFPLAPLFGKTSPTMEDYRVTLEFTDNPVWYAIQALPSVSVPQTDNVLSWFAAYYANTVASRMVKSTPAIRQMIERWNQQGGDSETLLSNLEKNRELKSVVLEETPWVLEAGNESAQKQRLITLFDANRIRYMNTQALDKLQSLQTGDGGWAWFKGMNGNVSITQWILYGMATIRPENSGDMIEKAVHFIDKHFKDRYEQFKKTNPRWQESRSFSTYELEYLLVRSYYPDIPLGDADEAARFYTGIVEKHWNNRTDLYSRALAARVMQQRGSTKTAQAILKSLREHASRKPDRGMYWANNPTHSFMTQSAVCVHTFIMEAFREAGAASAEMDEMKLWLLKQKQTQEWESVPATVNAIDMLLKTGGNWLESAGEVTVSLGNRPLNPGTAEPGTGYWKVFPDRDDCKELKSESITVTKKGTGPAWGALYRQYFEDIERITAAKTGLSVEKSLITPAGRPLQTGDKVVVRLTVRADRDMEFVHLKDLRASCFEPAGQLSGTQWNQGLVYYQSPKDASMHFFFPALPKGTYVFEYEVYVTAPGDYSNGIASIQCLYAPEFVSHTGGGRVLVPVSE
ncbi:MAG: hypothetical protein LBS46_08985 [Dysgonamonadaceae bacterium]|jgi:hypothetical protein|nr:hypothetical protein [Dysgonamonadaceae bacterium]